MLNIMQGTFALVSAGNTVNRWLLDGDDLQQRADAALDSHWGSKSVIVERGISGYAVAVDGHILDVYKTHQAAEQSIRERNS